MAGALTIFVILVISRFGNGGGIWVLVAPVSGNCILVTFLFVMCLFVIVHFRKHAHAIYSDFFFTTIKMKMFR